MTRDDIIRMAREAGLTVGTNLSGVMLVGSPSTPGIAHIDIDEMERFAALVAAAEREVCAKLALQGTGEAVQTRTLEILQSERQRIAAAIRGRGQA
jgi:hypothetical protein